MTPEKWQEVKAILEQAVEIDPARRARFLDALCVDDDDLRREVEQLLAADNTHADMLEGDAASSVFDHANSDDLIGSKIGHYTLVSRLGVGGMGTVFLAERSDGSFEQKVALKLIKRGMDSDAIQRRFVNERQILASLTHPNIAHLIDGGTTADGLPYFVMEHVDGVPITEFATGRNLDIKERLELFRDVCSAVSFAHQNLIVHRDLKPSNILVSNKGGVKLLDFGIAKLLKSETTGDTATQNFVFTPEYASPEQVRGEQLTTAADVYSLGVILYELLTGKRPYQAASGNISEIIRAVCETDPPRPSSVVARSRSNHPPDTKENRSPTTLNDDRLGRRLRGDLDSIILKALRKDPERRYGSVEQFSEDIRRHLEGLPVTASRDTWGYRASKFVKRNRISVVAAGLILITLLAGLFATLYQRNKAQQRLNDVRQLANSFLFEFHDAIKDLPGSTAVRELVVKRALEYLDRLSQESEGDAGLRRELAAAYRKIGQIQGNSYYSNLGDTEGAMKSYLGSFDILRELSDADPKNRELQHELADSHEGVGDMHYTANDLAQGLQSYEQAIVIREKIVAEEPANLEYRFALATALGKRGDISGMEGFANLGDIPRALDSYQRGLSIFEKLVEAATESEKYRVGYATMLHFYGMLQNSTGDARGAIENGRRAVAIFEALIAANPNNTKYETHLMATFVFMRYPLVDEQLFDEALANARRVIQTMEKQAAADPKNAFAKRSLGVSYNALGRIQTDMSEGAAAIENHQKALRIAEELSAADPQNGENNRDLAMTREFLADAQISKGDYAGAIGNYRAALDLYGDSAADALMPIYSGMARGLEGIGNLAEAVETIKKGFSSAEKSRAEAGPNVRKQIRTALYYFDGGRILARFALTQPDPERSTTQAEAREWLSKSLEILRDMQISGKLSKLKAPYLQRAAAEMAKLERD